LLSQADFIRLTGSAGNEIGAQRAIVMVPSNF
jgi:hypothetical protein